ncbi:MAG: 50S ribosomal protein L4 [Holosporales bacterium]|jgi:large subunit ribosomal protein L4|nr:50S ribosomal protein L4 [Holosporales bacterium]
MKVQILDCENNVSGELELSDSVFGVVPRKDILSRVILWQLAKRRSGNHSVKSKSEVSRTTRKFVKQKGSGGARHGSKKAPQFRGGAISFGPVVRDHGYKLQKKVRRLGLRMALSAKAKEGNLVIVSSLSSDHRLKTKEMIARFDGIGSALFVDTARDCNVVDALSNVVGYDFVPQIGANVYDIIRKNKLVISVDAVKELEGRLI